MVRHVLKIDNWKVNWLRCEFTEVPCLALHHDAGFAILSCPYIFLLSSLLLSRGSQLCSTLAYWLLDRVHVRECRIVIASLAVILVLVAPFNRDDSCLLHSHSGRTSGSFKKFLF